MSGHSWIIWITTELTLKLILFLTPSLFGGRDGRGSIFARGAEAPCPRTCFCNSVNRIVFCSRRVLQQIPDGIPEGTLQLNLNGNSFRTSVVQRTNFSRYIN